MRSESRVSGASWSAARVVGAVADRQGGLLPLFFFTLPLDLFLTGGYNRTIDPHGLVRLFAL